MVTDFGEKSNLHVGHREKLRNRFLNNGLESFEEHNVLELLLFYSIPQKDTNPLAHKLIDKFGSLAGVLDADMDALCTVDGISTYSASLIKLIPALANRYFSEKSSQPTEIYDTVGKIGELFVSKFISSTVEEVYVMLLDSRFSLIEIKKLNEGSVGSVRTSLRSVIEAAMSSKAAMAVIAHNHPSGLAIPSSEDQIMTENIRIALDAIEVKLLEHIIVSGAAYLPLLCKINKPAALSKEILEKFYSDYEK